MLGGWPEAIGTERRRDEQYNDAYPQGAQVSGGDDGWKKRYEGKATGEDLVECQTARHGESEYRSSDASLRPLASGTILHFSEYAHDAYRGD